MPSGCRIGSGMTEKVHLQTKPNYLQIISRPVKNKKARLSRLECQAFKVSRYHFSPPLRKWLNL